MYFSDCGSRETPAIHYITPRIGSLNGGQAITVKGQGNFKLVFYNDNLYVSSLVFTFVSHLFKYRKESYQMQ